MSSVFQELRRRIEARTARAGIIGLGYVGLPWAPTVAAAAAGGQRTGAEAA
jgi:UDP-N-acetyl-D-glucosamine dehydrogenase